MSYLGIVNNKMQFSMLDSYADGHKIKFWSSQSYLITMLNIL
jgi:hypothetical protein